MTISQIGTVQRLTIFGLTQSQSTSIIREIDKWIRNNGKEWTVSRLKLLKTLYIRRLTGSDMEWSWIKHRGSAPIGPFRPIFNLRNPKKALSCLMVYSELISPTLTKKQWTKFYNSVTHDRGKNGLQLFAPLRDKSIQVGHPRRLGSYDHNQVINYVALSKQRSPRIDSPQMKTFVADPIWTLRSFNHFLARSFIMKNPSFLNDIPTDLSSYIKDGWRSVDSVHDGINSDGVVGRISFLQEPGFKLRAIANPLPVFQILLNPLKSDLLKILMELPCDFTHDQNAGCLHVQRLLREGHRLSSVDLSDATNYLPLDDQANILEIVYGNHPLIKLFVDVSRSDWICDSPDGQIRLKWVTGQPLGLGPSFPSFALYHHFVMAYVISIVDDDPYVISRLVKFCRGESKDYGTVYPYAIVGDDIVMDARYTQMYLSVIQSLDCKVSYDKCLFDKPYGEFCSRIISKDDMIPQYKWKTVSDKSFLDLAKMLGPVSLSLLRPGQRKVVESLAEIPDVIGGPLGWNPQGIPLQLRVLKTWRKAEAFTELSKSESLSTRRREVHFKLKTELGLLWRFNTSLAVLANEYPQAVAQKDVRESPRQRFLKELLFVLKEYNYPTPARAVLLELFDVETVSEVMTQEERKALDWLLVPNDTDLVGSRWTDPRFEKLRKFAESWSLEQ